MSCTIPIQGGKWVELIVCYILTMAPDMLLFYASFEEFFSRIAKANGVRDKRLFYPFLKHVLSFKLFIPWSQIQVCLFLHFKSLTGPIEQIAPTHCQHIDNKRIAILLYLHTILKKYCSSDLNTIRTRSIYCFEFNIIFTCMKSQHYRGRVKANWPFSLG